MIRACAVIPYFEHPETLGAIVDTLRGHGLECWVVDDGSGQLAHTVAQELAERAPQAIRLITHAANRGKGAAVMSGCQAAAVAGFTHALQIDADGQHDLDDISEFLARAAQHPDALILGTPHFDRSMPAARHFGRHITHFWVWVHTLSLDVTDSMCGFRVYPLAPMLALASSESVGERMDFDIEVVVRLHWRGIRIIEIPTRVLYPRDGISHFKLWQDNVLITRMHTRLFFGMLRRSPRLLARTFRETRPA